MDGNFFAVNVESPNRLNTEAAFFMTHIEQYVIPYFATPGNFLEIGCWKGNHISQSKQLEDIGWKGICVDPFPSEFENRKAKLIDAAISKDGNPRLFIRVSIDRRHGGDVSYFSGFRDSINFHWPVISEHCNYEEMIIPTITFDYIKAPERVSFLSVDVEGAELEVFRGIDFNKYTFDMIMFEHNGEKNGVDELLQANGYNIHKSLELDNIYVK